MATTFLSLATALRFAVAAPRPRSEIAAAARPSAVASSSGQQMNALPDSLAHIISNRDLFRASRTPAAVRFDPVNADRPNPSQPNPARPAFVLSGILFGEQPAALLDGVPGFESTRVLHVGEKFGAYQVRAITSDRVVISAPDTTWTLRLKAKAQ
ncbi:MAG TPA: hypothetical protein VGI92_06330 [Gemmatimonadales bacterium]|jgi:type II secretory pathway component PulC